MNPAAHALIAPSGLHRIVQCPGSLRMEKMHPERGDDEDALDGTAAHWVLEQMIGGHTPVEGSITPNQRIVTGEMLEGADLAVEQIVQDLAPFGMGLQDVAVEQPVSIPRIHAECWGTPDVRAWVPAHRHPQGLPTLYLWDYKFGRRYVEVYENFQLVAYAVGALEATRLQDTDAQAVLGIIQPRSFHKDGPCRWWKVRFDRLRPLVNIAANRVEEALGDNPRAYPGPGCRDCRAKHACVTLQTSGYSLVDMAGKAQSLELSPEALGLEMATIEDAIARLEARKNGLDEQAESLMRRGVRVPGWALESGKGRTVWQRPAAEVIQMGLLFGKNLAKPADAITPRQAQMAGLDPAVVAAYSTTPSTAAKLVRNDGTRARKVFG